MFEAIVIIGIILLVLILFLLFRVSRLIGVMKGTDKEPLKGKSNKINGMLMLLFLIIGFGAFFWYSFATFDNYNVPIASEHGELTDTMFWVTTAITGFVFVLTNVLLFFFSWKYQYREDRKAKFYPDNMKLEVAWTLVPALVLTALVIGGLTVWSDITDEPAEDAEVVEIMGYQFAWGLRYPGKDNKLGVYDYRLIDATNIFGMDLTDPNSYDDFSPLQMHLPVGKEVLFKIRGRDVIHSVFAPHFRLKMDAVPGMPTHFKFIPTKTTEQMRQETGDPEFNYEIACTEVCGRGHFSMRVVVVVQEQDEYEQWKREQRTWLQINNDYLARIPEQYREMARIKSGLGEEGAEEPASPEQSETEEIEVEQTQEEASI
ncbi:MAG: cytochrome c oxidase subunit II [Candidatus Cyclobacteriaceae bacterium M2_1C_046]